MSQWLVNRGHSQFTVDGLGDLERLARQGELDAGDLIQPDGADDWLYAIEIPELKTMVKSSMDDDDIEFRRKGSGALKGLLYVVFGVMFLGGVAGMGYFFTQLPSGDESLLGKNGALSYTEVLTLTDVAVLSAPEEGAASVTTVGKDSVLDLLAKRGDYYKVAVKDGAEGWVRVEDILAVYEMGDDKVRREKDPLFNPDQYAKVSNASWHMIDEDGNTTATFSFMLENTAIYDMTDIRLEAVIKDSKGTEVDSVEFAIDGILPADDSTMVGTLAPPEDVVKAAEKAGEEPPPSELMSTYTFNERVKELPEGEEKDAMYNRWLDGVEIEVEDRFVEATVSIVELRAIPKE